MLVLSVCLSVCGWYAVDILRLIHNALQRDSPNSPENFASICDMISVGRLSRFQILRRTIVVISFAVVSISRPIKCAILVDLSTTTQTCVYPWNSGGCMMKSVEIDVDAA